MQYKIERYVLWRPLQNPREKAAGVFQRAFVAGNHNVDKSSIGSVRDTYDTKLVENAILFSTMDFAEIIRGKLMDIGRVYQLKRVEVSFDLGD